MRILGKYAFLVILMSLISGQMDAGYTIRSGKILNTKYAATLPASEHYRLGMEAIKASDWTEASLQFNIVSINFPKTAYGQEAFFYLGVADYNLEELDSSNEAFTQYIKVQNNPQFFEETMQYKYAIATKFKEGSRRRFFGSKQLPKWASGKELAIEIYDEVTTALPCHELAALSLYAKGHLLREKHFYRESIDVYTQLIRRFPKHELAPESYIAITCAYLEQSESEFQNPDLLALAQINLRRFSQDFPRDDRCAKAEKNLMSMKEVYAQGLFDVGQFYERKKEPRASVIYYQNAIEQFPDTHVAGQCKDRIAVLSETLIKPTPYVGANTEY